MIMEERIVVVRNIIHIDEEKCNGCGECISACVEGALLLADGKAKLVSDIYCDGLGACIGECPTGALTVERRESELFDEEAVKARIGSHQAEKSTTSPASIPENTPREGGVCPGAMMRRLQRRDRKQSTITDEEPPSELVNWPVQLHLIPVNAPYLQGARLLVAADCVPCAYAGFHRELLAGRKLTIGCPKLDNAEFYVEKLTRLFQQNDIQSIDVAYMEVPCCFGLVQVIKLALESSGKTIPLTLTKIGVQGSICDESQSLSA